MDMVSADLLKTFEFFKGFGDEELRQLEDIASTDSYKAGAQLWKKGDPAKRLLLLKEGKVLMTLDIDVGPHRPPIQVTVDVVTKGEGLGWSAVVEPYLYTRGVRCIDDSEVIAFDGAKLREVLDRDKAFGYKFMHVIARVIRNRLAHTEIILVGERGLATLTEM
jgi:CRP-like cAMP-binding protein